VPIFRGVYFYGDDLWAAVLDMTMIRNVVSFSGGMGSWAAAKRVAASAGVEGLVLLFADTLIEDPDTYRFLDEAALNIGAPLTRIADGRTPWQVMSDEHVIGNTRIDVCSRILKRELLAKWIAENCDPAVATLHVGIDWSESHRLEGVRQRNPGWSYQAPMCEPPYLDKAQVLEWALNEGLRPPTLYAAGFPHNNCGGACVKAGQAQWALLLRTHPERYLAIEAWEDGMRERVGDYSILRDRRGGKTKALPLRAFRERLVPEKAYDSTEWGGCGCAIE
jgi:hypothetical protein